MRKGGGGRYQTLPLSDLCLDVRRVGKGEGGQESETGPAIRRASESLAKCRSGEGKEEEEEGEQIMCNKASCLFLLVFFITPTHIFHHLTSGWEVKLG